jgi:hypothetical protein
MLFFVYVRLFFYIIHNISAVHLLSSLLYQWYKWGTDSNLFWNQCEALKGITVVLAFRVAHSAADFHIFGAVACLAN